MATAVATVRALGAGDAVGQMMRAGNPLRDGLEVQAAGCRLGIRYAVPVQMPFMTFKGQVGYTRARVFCAASSRTHRAAASSTQLVSVGGSLRR
jgi:glutamate-1-semialdehyde 2,1-aminomutase